MASDSCSEDKSCETKRAPTLRRYRCNGGGARGEGFLAREPQEELSFN